MDIADKLIQEHRLTKDEGVELLNSWQDPAVADKLAAEALRVRREVYGNDIYIRGLIEFTNICKNNCFYCGIRKSNPEPDRYRLKKDEILDCCAYGYKLGFRTFVLQGGEDGYFTDERLTDIVKEIKSRYPDCALTLSVGERSYESYKLLREAGADRYLLREETANEDHYKRLHPSDLSLHTRLNCLYDLTSLDYQVGAGFMVGSPYQTMENIAEDLVFIQDLEPEMVGIGPFIPHKDTRFADFPAGSVELTLFLLSVIRILLPDVLLPATTAVASMIDPEGRVKAMLAGANVLMPNISPIEHRKEYTLYDNKEGITSNAESKLKELKESMEAAGFEIVFDRGDHKTLLKSTSDSETDELEKEEKKKKKKKRRRKRKNRKTNKRKRKKEKPAHQEPEEKQAASGKKEKTETKKG